jgi:PleD family two-component response regulator
MGRIETIKAPLGSAFAALPLTARVLVAEGALFDLTRLRRLVAKLDFVTDIVHASHLDEIRRQLENSAFDLVLIGDTFAGGIGFDVLDRLQASKRNRDAATVFVADCARADVAMEALKRGCGDYICKDDLSPSAMRRAAINAFQKAGLRAMMERTEA